MCYYWAITTPKFTSVVGSRNIFKFSHTPVCIETLNYLNQCIAASLSIFFILHILFFQGWISIIIKRVLQSIFNYGITTLHWNIFKFNNNQNDNKNDSKWWMIKFKFRNSWSSNILIVWFKKNHVLSISKQSLKQLQRWNS